MQAKPDEPAPARQMLAVSCDARDTRAAAAFRAWREYARGVRVLTRVKTMLRREQLKLHHCNNQMKQQRAALLECVARCNANGRTRVRLARFVGRWRRSAAHTAHLRFEDRVAAVWARKSLAKHCFSSWRTALYLATPAARQAVAPVNTPHAATCGARASCAASDMPSEHGTESEPSSCTPLVRVLQEAERLRARLDMAVDAAQEKQFQLEATGSRLASCEQKRQALKLRVRTAIACELLQLAGTRLAASMNFVA